MFGAKLCLGAKLYLVPVHVPIVPCIITFVLTLEIVVVGAGAVGAIDEGISYDVALVTLEVV